MNDEERLRAALAQVEPEPLDATGIIASARAKQARQRQLIAGGMASVAAVAVIGGVGVLSLGGSPNTSSAPEAAAPASATSEPPSHQAPGAAQADEKEAGPAQPKATDSSVQTGQRWLTGRPQAAPGNVRLYLKDGQWCRVSQPSDVCQPFAEGRVPVDATTTLVVGRIPQTAVQASATGSGPEHAGGSRPVTLWRTPDSDWTIIVVTHPSGDVAKVTATDARGDIVWRSE